MSLRALALLSGVYDLLLGVPLLLAAPLVARLFGAPPPVPVVNAWLNGVFTVALGLGYFWATADAEAPAILEDKTEPGEQGAPAQFHACDADVHRDHRTVLAAHVDLLGSWRIVRRGQRVQQ